MITENPLSRFKLATIDSIAKVRYLTSEEETRLKNAINARDEQLKLSRKRFNTWKHERGLQPLPDRMAFTFADHMAPMIQISLHTGPRQGEVFNLKWENVNYERATIAIAGNTAKNGKTRHIPLNSVALQVLSNWQKQSQPNDLIFPGKNGDKFNNVKKAWTSLLKSAQIDNFRWHDMRHHFASKLVMAGVDLNTVRELLGHADIKMTLRYAHLAPEYKASAVEKLV